MRLVGGRGSAGFLSLGWAGCDQITLEFSNQPRRSGTRLRRPWARPCGNRRYHNELRMFWANSKSGLIYALSPRSMLGIARVGVDLEGDAVPCVVDADEQQQQRGCSNTKQRVAGVRGSFECRYPEYRVGHQRQQSVK